jgi:IS5 family transposase
MQTNTQQLSFSTLSLSKRKLKSEFFDQMNQLLDWTAIEIEIRKHYNKGFSVAGRPSYSGLLLFKMSLLQTWYGLSDYEVEEKVNDSLSFMKFVGLSLEDDVPDHSVLSRFRTALTQKGGYEKLMEQINGQLETRGVLLKKGAIVDASITDSPRKPRGKKEYEVVEDRKEEPDATGDGQEPGTAHTVLAIKTQSHVDTEAAWIKKAGKLRFGYKKHIATDNQGLVRAVITTAVNESDIIHLEDVVKKASIDKGSRVRADKGYSSESNRHYLRSNGLKDGVMYKAVRNKPLTSHQQKFNKIVSQTRFKVERTFGGITRWFKTGVTRYVGQAKTHTQHLLEAIAYNLYRSPGIVVSNAELSAK